MRLHTTSFRNGIPLIAPTREHSRSARSQRHGCAATESDRTTFIRHNPNPIYPHGGSVHARVQYAPLGSKDCSNRCNALLPRRHCTGERLSLPCFLPSRGPKNYARMAPSHTHGDGTFRALIRLTETGGGRIRSVTESTVVRLETLDTCDSAFERATAADPGRALGCLISPSDCAYGDGLGAAPLTWGAYAYAGSHALRIPSTCAGLGARSTRAVQEDAAQRKGDGGDH